MMEKRTMFSAVTASLAVLAFAGSASAAGPIAYWNMDEAAGATVALDSVGIADAVAAAADGATPPTAGAAGILGNAWTFNESNDSVLDVPVPNQAVFTTLGHATGLSYSGWFNTTDGGGANTIFSISDKAAGSEEAALDVDNNVLRFLARHNTLDNIDITSTATVDDGQWHHAAVTSSVGAGTILYLDGAPVSSSPFAVDIASFTANTANIVVNFGANDDNSAVKQWEYEGMVDEFSVYAFALTPADVAYIAANPGAQVPEPASLMLLAAGISCMGMRRWK